MERLTKNESGTSLLDLLGNPQMIVNLPKDVAVGLPDEETWAVLRRLLPVTHILYAKAVLATRERAEKMFGLRIGKNALLFSFASKTDKGLSLGLYVHSIPNEDSNTGFYCRFVRYDLRRQLRPGVWAVARLKIQTSGDFGVLTGDPAKPDELKRLRLPRNLEEVFGLYVPTRFGIWIERQKGDTQEKEVVPLISAPQDILDIPVAEGILKEWLREEDVDIWEIINDPSLPDLREIFISDVGRAMKYMVRAIGVNGRVLGEFINAICKMEPKEIKPDVLSPTGSFINMGDSEWKSYSGIS